ncbi:MAG: SGNH/GDSL hydrolase family protein [Aquaticitalea sp.]
MKKIVLLCIVSIFTFGACSNKSEEAVTQNTNEMNDSADDADTTKTNEGTLKILALGDSYTIGQSVCETCRFPEQLKDSLINVLGTTDISLDIIAQTGWTTTNLITAINTQNPASDYDLVTLLIGVNNQYQHKPFEIYTNEFPVLIQKAIASAKGDKSKVIVVSIPDYAYTFFGQSSSNPVTISTELDQYNAFAKAYCVERDITFINITDITRLGLEQPELVASDGLHPSELAYSKFVERLLPLAIEKLQ